MPVGDMVSLIMFRYLRVNVLVPKPKKYRNMKARLRTYAVVTNTRHSPRYVCA